MKLCDCVGSAMTRKMVDGGGRGWGCMLRAISLMVRWSRGKRERLGCWERQCWMAGETQAKVVIAEGSSSERRSNSRQCKNR